MASVRDEMGKVGEVQLQRNTSEELKMMMKKLFEEEYYSSILERQKSAGLHIRLKTVGGTSNADLEKRILEDISNSNGPLSTLVFGDSGTGKSWFALNLVKTLYDSPEYANKIPVYIPLGQIEKMIRQQKAQPSSSFRSDILFSFIMNHTNHFPTKIQDRELQNLYLDLCACELILVLDGYDELKVKSNLWEENKWRTKDFKNIRTIVSCRPNALVDVDVSKLFGFTEELQCSYVIWPLQGNIVGEYISQVPLFLHSIEYDSKVNDPWMMTKSITKDYPKWESTQQDSEYKNSFLDKLPELQGLAQNVFILTTICQLLPKLVETEKVASKKEDLNDEFMQKLQEICRTEVLLYDRFTETWFKYQVERMEPTGHAPFLYENRYILRHYMGGYAQNLAMRCAQLDREMLSNGEISEDKTLFWNLWTPWSPNSEKFYRNEKIEKQLFPQNENDTDEDRLENLKFLRNSCLLRYESGAQIFRFLHLSLLEYFLSREVFEKYRGALNYYSNWNRRREGIYFLINQHNINDPEFSGVLSMLVGRAETDENFQATLLKAVKKSATLPGIEQMASNALTILNLSGYSFSGKNHEGDDFQNIQVPGANFRNSICGNTDFSGPNFENAKLNQGWFQGCKFQGANFSNCSFGQIPPINLNLQNFLIHDVLCCSNDGFEHVIICCEDQSPTTESAKLYINNYKLDANFEFVDCKSFFVQEITEEIESIFSLVELPSSIVLFVFVPCVLGFLDEKIMRPDSWYEFSSNSVLNSGKFEETQLNLQHHLKIFNKMDTTKKFILFSPNKLPEFCDKETSMSVYERNRKNGVRPLCARWIKYIWIPFGPFKFLVSISSRHAGEIGGIIDHVSVLNNWKPILCNDKTIPLEIFWQVDNYPFHSLSVQESFWFQQVVIHSRGSYFDDNVILSIPSSANIYFFELKHNKVLTVLKNNIFNETVSNNNSAISERIVFTRYPMESNKEIPGYIANIATKRNVGCVVSQKFDLIALKNRLSTEVFRVENGKLSQNVLKDFQTPITFRRSNGSAYLVYVFKCSLHFEKLDVIEHVPKKKTSTKPTGAKYLSEDGTLFVVVVPSTPLTAIFDIWKLHSEAGSHVLKESFDRRIQFRSFEMPKQKHRVLITPRNLVVFFYWLFRPPVSLTVPQLNGYDAESGKIFQVKGIPYEKMSQGTKVLMFQDLQEIAFRNDEEFACYSVTEIICGDKFAVELNPSVSFTCNFQSPEFYIDPNEKRIYFFSKKDTNFDRIGIWDLQNNTYGTFDVKNYKIVQPNISLCTVLLKTKIIQGYCNKKSLHIESTNEYSTLHAESPVHVSSSSKLGWIVAQFRNGDLVILESRKLITLFVFCGFQPGFKFQITLKSLQEVRIALIKDYAGEVVWLSLNAVGLRQYYEQGKLKEFKDWKVNKSEVPSSSLSLSEVDISCSRAMDKRFGSLFKFHGSLGSPSEGDAYKPFCNLFLPVTDYQHSILTTSDSKQLVDLTTKNWTVTVITKKNKFKQLRQMVHGSVEQHAALIIEGILHGGHFVIRAELTRENKIVKIKCESCRGKSLYEEIIKKYFGKQLQVNPEMGMKLLKNIWVDTYNLQWKYNLLHHNCNSWCKEKLQVLNIESKFKSKPYKLFADLPKDFELKEFKFTK